MKKILAMAAVAALAAGASVYAANPFSDVSTSDWAYQAVADLSDQGVVEGYPDGTFKGQNNITRYEMAQIIARLMAKEDQLNAEQRATIDKLAGEYADELNTLGVRVADLEKKVGNLKFSGDARFKWNQGYRTTSEPTRDGKAKDLFNARLRVKAVANINDSTYAVARLSSGNTDLRGNNWKDPATYPWTRSQVDGDVYMDMMYIHHQFGDKVGMNLGRSYYTSGQTGIWYDDYFDGAQLYIGDAKLTAELGYGRFQEFGVDVFSGSSALGSKDTNPEAGYARLYGKSGPVAYDVEYVKLAHDYGEFWNAGLTANVTKDVDVFGDFIQNNDMPGDPQMWTAGLAYGHYNVAKPGTFRIAAQYVSAETGAYYGSGTYFANPLDWMYNWYGPTAGNGQTANTVTERAIDKTTFWLASADVILAKNVRLHGEYSFSIDTTGTSKFDYDNLASLQLVYTF